MTGQEFTKGHEGFSPTPYRDTEGLLTFGYGRCLDRNRLKSEEMAYLMRGWLQQDFYGRNGFAIEATCRDFAVVPLDREEGDWLFERDYAAAEKAMRASFRRRLGSHASLLGCAPRQIVTRQAALIDMAYQMGEGGLYGFEKMWLAIGKGDWEEAARECLDSLYARKHPTRAGRVAEMLRTGEWPDA